MTNLYTIEQLKAGFKSGEFTLAADEYLKDGLPYCKKCGGARFYGKDGHYILSDCECIEEEKRKTLETMKAEERLRNFNERKKSSLLGERYQGVMFDTATITPNNEKVYNRCKNYVAQAEAVLGNNIGLYIYGDNSSGKTHLTACMCNELTLKGYRCVYTNLATILAEIRKNINDCEILTKLKYYDFAFIDDLGKEFIGREYNQGSAKWAESQLFEILNARYNSQRPIIFSSNYSIAELASILNLDKAIVERINEMATRVLKLEGDDFRTEEREKKSGIAKKLGI